MITTDIIFDRRKLATLKKEGTVEIKVTINRKNQYISTGIRLFKNEWKFGKIINRPDADALMERLYALKNKIEREVARCIDNGTEPHLKTIRDNISSTSTESDMFIWMLAEVGAMRVAGGTIAHYNNTIDKLRKFGKIRSFDDAIVGNIREWDRFLHTLKKPHSDERLSDAGIYNYHKCLKSLFNIALKEERLKQNPYDLLKGAFKRGDKENVEYLVEEEMHAIENLQNLSRIYDEARDLFVFQMYTGLPYSDLMAFSIDDYKNINGKWIKRSERIKTGVPYVNQLLPPALAVLEKYAFSLPHINNAEYNERLKVVGRLAGISTPLHSHLGRHTFATFMLSNGVSIEHLSKMLGHTNITQTQRYAKVLAKDIRESFDMIEQKLKKK